MITDREANEQTSRQTHTTAKSATADTGSRTGTETRSAGTGEEYSTTDCASAEGLMQKARDHLFECDRNARYHVARRSFLDQVHRWMMVAVLVSGTAAAVFGMGDDWIYTALMLLPAAVGAISVVFELPTRARNHEMMARRFYQIAVQIDPEHATAEDVFRWRNEIFGVYEDETAATYHGVEAECYNEASGALGKKTHKKTKGWRYRLRHWWAFSKDDFPHVVPE